MTRASILEHAEKSRLENTVDSIIQHQNLAKADLEIVLQLAKKLDFLFV